MTRSVPLSTLPPEVRASLKKSSRLGQPFLATAAGTPPETPLVAMTFRFPLPPNLLNPARKSHWAVKHRGKVDFYDAADSLQEAGILPPPPRVPFVRVRVSATLYMPKAMDDDNAMARASKWPMDWLKTRGYITDDRKQVVTWTGFPTQVVGKLGRPPRVELTLQPEG